MRTASCFLGLMVLAGGAIASAAEPATLPNSRDVILAQQFPGFGARAGFGQPQTAPRDHSRQLVEMIQGTIAPDSWDVRGGRGVVRAWPQGHALVIRQTGNTHHALGDLIRGLR